MTKQFYQITSILDNIKVLQEPTEDQINIVINLLSEEKFSRYFFYDIDNPIWIPILHEKGFFYSTPEPVEVENGAFKITDWPAGKYLARFSDQFENITINIINSIQTENWRVQEIMIDAMVKIPPCKSAELVSVINYWIDGRFSEMLPVKLNSLADYFLTNQETEAACKLLEYVITPILSSAKKPFSEYDPIIRFRSEKYWANEYCVNQSPKLINNNPVNVLSVFQKQLSKVIELVKQIYPEKCEYLVGYLYRMDIAHHISDQLDADAIDILIDGTINSLSEACQQNEEEGNILLTNFLDSEHVIFKRISLYILRSFGSQYPDLLNQAMSQHEYLDKYEYANEFRELLRDQFGNIPEGTQNLIISWIISGPSDIDERAKRYARWDNREATDKDRRNIKEDWILYHLELIREYLSGNALSQLDQLTTIHGKPNIEEKPAVSVASWTGSKSPIPSKELSTKTFDELKQTFITNFSEDSSRDSQEGLGQAFQVIVRENPEKYLAFARYLIDPIINPLCIYNYLFGLREGLNENREKLNDHFFKLMKFIGDQTDDPFMESSAEFKPGLLSIQSEMIQIIEETLKSDDFRLTRHQLDLIRGFLLKLAHHPDPLEEESYNMGFDPYVKSLNCIRGKAMHAVINYSLYLVRRDKKETGQQQKEGYIEPQIQEILDEKLDVSIESSLAIHSVYGANIPQLNYLSHFWLNSNISRIFPENDNMSEYWEAAWYAYISISRFYSNIFSLLIQQYKRGIRLLTNPEAERDRLGISPNERLSEHVLIAYLNKLTDFNHENEILDMFFEFASDKTRGHAVFWLSQILKNEKLSADNIIWNKCFTLWQNRLSKVSSDEVNNNLDEMSSYMRWLEYCPMDLGNIYPMLEESIKYLSRRYESQLLVKFISKNSTNYPLEAIKILWKTVNSEKESWWKPKDNDEEIILRSALNCNNQEARYLATEIINLRGERGDFRWKVLLTEFHK